MPNINTKIYLLTFLLLLLLFACQNTPTSSDSPDTTVDSTQKLILVDVPAENAILDFDSSIIIHWTMNGHSGNKFNIHLFNESTNIYTITTDFQRSTSTNARYNWTSIYSPLGTGSQYRIRVQVDEDSSIYGYSKLFTIRNPYFGGFRINIPDTSTIWAFGNTYTILWDTLGYPGNTVSFALYQDDKSILSIGKGLTNRGTYSWTLPTSIGDGKYYIKISSDDYPPLSAYGDTFRILGIQSDSFETDNNPQHASLLILNSPPQRHTLSHGDTDVVSFFAQKDTQYVFFASIENCMSILKLYDEAGTVLFSSNNRHPPIVWNCLKDGIYYISMVPYEIEYPGIYSFSIKTHSHNNSDIFLSPTEETTWIAGTSISIQWADSAAFYGVNKRLYCYSGQNRILTITGQTSNNNSYSWTPPVGLPTDSNYRIIIENYDYPIMTDSSDFFTIKGVDRDVYEPDDDVTTTNTVISGDNPQSHTLTLNDSDYCRFTGISNNVYQISIIGDPHPTLHLFNENSSLISSKNTIVTSQGITVNWYCPTNGNYFLLAYGSPNSYQISLQEYDSSAFRFIINSPKEEDSYTDGDLCQIIWKDSIGFGGKVDIFLINGEGSIFPISQSNTLNTGLYDWTIPATIAIRDDYSIKIISQTNSNVFGVSPTFSIY
ncbi:MAG: hypothetical protein A2293_10165 [Elusimicrobia bacterium RIFOXYB2_FULL_49_7]|nr:MAG: hypothetical protein A2293_10165 [Elusimicrobia bacterium RIFOXYB2_FULL_49_7]